MLPISEACDTYLCSASVELCVPLILSTFCMKYEYYDTNSTTMCFIWFSTDNKELRVMICLWKESVFQKCWRSSEVSGNVISSVQMSQDLYSLSLIANPWLNFTHHWLLGIVHCPMGIQTSWSCDYPFLHQSFSWEPALHQWMQRCIFLQKLIFLHKP